MDPQQTHKCKLKHTIGFTKDKSFNEHILITLNEMNMEICASTECVGKFRK